MKMMKINHLSGSTDLFHWLDPVKHRSLQGRVHQSSLCLCHCILSAPELSHNQGLMHSQHTQEPLWNKTDTSGKIEQDIRIPIDSEQS